MIRRPPISTLFPYPTLCRSMASWNNTIVVPGWDSLPPMPDEVPYLNPVTPEFLRTMGTRVVRGRDFLPTDVRGAAPVVIVKDRKSTRLNSSHANISYAVFCL